MPSWLDRWREQLDRARGIPPSTHLMLRGLSVTVVNTRPNIETSFVAGRLDAALALIERWQPWRLAHLRRDLAQVWVASFPCRGAYFPASRTVMTELSFLARAGEFSDAQVASSIVHEGVHARVHRMGERLGFDWARRDMAREERLCRRAELAFGRALPSALAGPVIDRAMASLALADEQVAPTIDWEAAHAAKRQADAEAVRASDRRRHRG